MKAHSPWRSRLAGPALGALMLACCLAGPLLLATLGTITIGAWLGAGCALIVAAGICLFAWRVRSGSSC